MYLPRNRLWTHTPLFCLVTSTTAVR